MSRPRSLLALAAMMLGTSVLGAELAPELRTERQRIAVERKRLEAAFAEEEARCQGRFAVTACVDDVRQRRRAALESPRARELEIDDIERRQRAAERREAIDEKQRRAAERPVMPSSPAASARPPVAPTPAASVPRAVREPPSADEARQRAIDARQRQDEFRARQQRIEARQAQRAGRGQRAAPLPVPASAAGARRP
ncbi:MAG: hypothetical protein JNM33_02925 [Rubrivivax sp.]|nr:hypothetical protein [Rubrivivax sp.]